MRETIPYIVLLGALTTGYVAIKNRNATTSTEAQQNVLATYPKPTSIIYKKTKPHYVSKGVKHEGRSSITASNTQSTSSRKNEELADATTEIESLTSIYENHKGRHRESVKTKLDLSAQPKSPIHGVKVAAWIASKENQVPTTIADPTLGDGLRVFFNCMELKKQGPKVLNDHDCEAIASRESVDSRRRYE